MCFGKKAKRQSKAGTKPGVCAQCNKEIQLEQKFLGPPYCHDCLEMQRRLRKKKWDPLRTESGNSDIGPRVVREKTG